MKDKLIVIVLMVLLSCNKDYEYQIFEGNKQTKQMLLSGKISTLYMVVLPDCPLANNYTAEFKKIANKYLKQVNCYLILPNNMYSHTEIAHFLNKYNLKFPLILDEEQALIKQYQVSVSPTFIFVDSLGDLLYKGKLDNRIVSLGTKRFKGASINYLDSAMTEYYLGEPIKVKETKAVGCLLE